MCDTGVVYNIEILIAGVWCDWRDEPDFIKACYWASYEADKYGENKVRIIDPEGKVL